MRFIDALRLIDVAIKNNILEEMEGKVLVYREAAFESKEGWYLSEKDEVAMELMESEQGQDLIISRLKEMNVDFEIKK